MENRFDDTGCFHTTPDDILIDRDVVGSEETVELVKEAKKHMPKQQLLQGKGSYGQSLSNISQYQTHDPQSTLPRNKWNIIHTISHYRSTRTCFLAETPLEHHRPAKATVMALGRSQGKVYPWWLLDILRRAGCMPTWRASADKK